MAYNLSILHFMCLKLPIFKKTFVPPCSSTPTRDIYHLIFGGTLIASGPSELVTKSPIPFGFHSCQILYGTCLLKGYVDVE